jgi:hypothetical protein
MAALVPMNFFGSESKANEIAAAYASGDLDWTYTVVSKGKYFIVEVRDEDGHHIGTL